MELDNKTPINQEQLSKGIEEAYKKQTATCKNETKWSRAMLRAELEELDLLNENIKVLQQVNTTLSQIGQPAIAYYFEIMKQKLAQAKEEKERATSVENIEQ